MKRITLKIGLTMALLVLVGSVYSQTVVNNLVRLVSLTPAAGGTSLTTALTDDSNITVNASGVVTIGSDYTPTAFAGNTTGTVLIGGARDKTFTIRLSTATVINQTAGTDFGAITSTGGIHRGSGSTANSDNNGGIGVQQGVGTGIDNGEGINFGFDLTNLPSTVGVQITAVSLSTFAGAATAETALVINRQDTSKTLAMAGTAGGNGVRRSDITSLGVIIPGGTVDYDVLSVLNNSPTGVAQSFRVSGIEIRIVAFSSTWNGTTWSNATPGPAVDATIEGNYSTLTSGGFSAKTLTINSGSLTIESTKSVKVENGVTNNAGATGIIVEEGGTLHQVQAEASNSGAITVRKNSNSLKRGDYTLWSSPVSGSLTLAGFSPLTSQSPTNRFYVYDHTLGTNGLFANIDPSSTFATGTGYLIRMPNENPTELGTSSAYYTSGAAITFNGEFVGVPNNGTLTTTGLTADKFYSIGNPYPSNLSADSFINGNSTGGTLYFWRKTNGVVGTAYATYTLLGGAGTSAGNGGIGVPSGIIAPCQGFIVKTGAAATTLTFTNAMRLTNATYGKFFKTKQEATKDRVWLNLSNATGAISQALIGYMDSATLGVDNGIDGEYLNDSPIALTSNIDNKEYTIQGRPTFDASDVVALNFKTDVAGDYSIALGNFDGVFATGQDVYLVDSKTGIDTDLKAGSYNFKAEAGVDNSRFSLKYQKTLKVIDSELIDISVTVYSNNGSLFVKSNASTINTVKIFDIQGRLIAEQKNVKSNTASFSNLKTNQALIVQVSSDDNTVVSKKIVN
jgi:hypothetical protein